MITLNLLPPEEKRELKSQQMLRRISVFGASSLLYIVVFLVLLSTVRWSLQIQLKAIEEISKKIEESDQNRDFQKFKQEVDQINRQLKYFFQLHEETINYSTAITQLTEKAIPGIEFRQLSLNGQKVSLGGRANNRDTLIMFKEALVNSPDFQNLDVPLSNFLQQNNIDFSFNFELKSHN